MDFSESKTWFIGVKMNFRTQILINQTHEKNGQNEYNGIGENHRIV